MRAVVTSVVRYAVPNSVSSWMRVLDLETGRLMLTTRIPESNWRLNDPNPRGGQRGARGVSVHDGRLVVSNAERLFVLDRSWRLTSELTHRLMADNHDVLAERRGIWVAATGCDTLLLIGWDGTLVSSWRFCEDKQVLDELGFPGSLLPPLESGVDYRDPKMRGREHAALHINCLGADADGLLLSFGRVVNATDGPTAVGRSAIVRMTEEDGHARLALLQHAGGARAPNHNVDRVDGLLIYNDSNRNRLVAYDLERGAEARSVAIPGKPPFARGLRGLGSNRWLVGSQAPLAVHVVDLGRGKVVRSYELEHAMEHESVYAICMLPDDFDDPVQPAASDPYTFWRRASLPPGVTPIP